MKNMLKDGIFFGIWCTNGCFCYLCTSDGFLNPPYEGGQGGCNIHEKFTGRYNPTGHPPPPFTRGIKMILNLLYIMKKITIAIDGFSSCGKSTMAKDLAREVGYIYIDSGAMYRAVTLYCLENQLFTAEGIDTEKLEAAMPGIQISFQLNPETGRPMTFLNGANVEDRIRTMEVSNHVSPVAALPFVREALVKLQQEMGKEKGIVMDGRDIGTTVFPEAELKIFVTASAEVRAQRRYDELKAKGQEASYEEILANVKERDYIDQNREVSPLRKADDAILLDNSNLTIEEQKQWLAAEFEKAVK